ncbi:EAL domain-containing protein [Sulfurimonas sp. HSL-1716]|uniref:EAL domain-containing protein n=1 Tax=Hydrocurvibacter sulfurireducens TaxID=3131937 RepID=UPI0031F971A8
MSKMLDISVLYVEDEETIRNSVTRSLALMVKDVHVAENGEEALLSIKDFPIDLIITDIRMPKLDGLSLIEKLRNDGLDVPVIITSAFNEIEYLNKAIDLNVDKFINKPIRLNTLMDAITKIAQNIENKKQLKERMEQLSRYRKVIEDTNFIIYVSPDKELIGINEEFTRFIKDLDIDPKSIKSIDDIFQKEDTKQLMQKVLDYQIFSSQITLNFEDKRFSVLLTAFASVFHGENIKEITFLFKDLTSVLKDKDELIQRLYTDDLTGLPNRQKLFSDLLESEHQYDMMIIDVDGFSKINHLYGFKSGDSILKQITKVLKSYWPDTRPHTLYRADMDHFVILSEKMDPVDIGASRELAQKIIKYLEEQTFTILNETEIDVNFTIGACCDSNDDLYAEASLALEMAKSMHSNFKCFNDFEDIKPLAEKNLQMQIKIKRALKEGKILNYYQPIVDAEGKLVKYEALVRMEDPDTGKILTPYHFLDIARESKNYTLLTKQVINNAFSDFKTSKIPFSINLSFVDIVNPEIVLMLEQMIKQHQGPPLTIELLENEGFINISETIKFCKNMKSFGAKIAIDDFGSGYSNFIYFFDMPIDILKIDGALIKRVHDYRGYLALETIVGFARNLGIKIVAEFVEDKETFEKLQELKIEMYQGYYFSEPKAFDEL